ncbi:MAG: hypothetical protein ACREE7_14305, partial [Dongiaceae bacterium]
MNQPLALASLPAAGLFTTSSSSRTLRGGALILALLLHLALLLAVLELPDWRAAPPQPVAIAVEIVPPPEPTIPPPEPAAPPPSPPPAAARSG